MQFKWNVNLTLMTFSKILKYDRTHTELITENVHNYMEKCTENILKVCK